ncbi:MAG: hypothetical protein J07HQW2_02967 [Haloquadratum walsbyi J07HQW2]|uniref:Uncharacterized protein n=1 Tax=Haloquadratum walsbyi J07HQW2 TaxID=1238425 RepID=U1PRU3_9EURY|nr:MAG: hypothetical protein J07HQW2_02967 [Haloquadratum walsbyi J07HQW2]
MNFLTSDAAQIIVPLNYIYSYLYDKKDEPLSVG